MTRIGYVVKVYPRFSETFIVTEILAREAHGDHLDVFALRPTTDARFHPELARIQANVHWVQRPTLDTGFWNDIGSALHHPALGGNFHRLLPELTDLPVDEVAQGVRLATMIYEQKITHLHAHFASLPGRMAWIAGRITGIPYTVTTHAKDIFHNSVDHTWLRRICAEADRVIAISEYNERYLRSVIANTSARISLCYNALELDRFTFRPAPQVSGSFNIAAVGRLVPKKGFEYLIAAVGKLRDESIDVTLHLGGAGELYHQLRAQIADLHLEKQVHLLGPMNQSEVRELLYNSQVFVAPSVPTTDGNIDGLPTVVLEAMACGTPVIATTVTGLPEVIHDRETGMLVPPGNVEALATALRQLTDGKVNTSAFITNARALIENQFDSRQQAAQLSTWQQS